MKPPYPVIFNKSENFEGEYVCTCCGMIFSLGEAIIPKPMLRTCYPQNTSFYKCPKCKTEAAVLA